MTSNHLLAAIAAAAALASGAASARHEHVEADAAGMRAARDACVSEARADRCAGLERHAGDRHRDRAGLVLQAVPNASLPDQASYGWRYFSDARAATAVMISPAGEYFLSRGDGPKQITGLAGGALNARPEAN